MFNFNKNFPTVINKQKKEDMKLFLTDTTNKM